MADVGMDAHTAKVLVERWKQAWERLDTEAVCALYTENAEHSSPSVAHALPELGRKELRGISEIRRFADVAKAAIKELRFDILSITHSENRIAVEYLRYRKPGSDELLPVVEMLEYHGDLLSRVAVYHG